MKKLISILLILLLIANIILFITQNIPASAFWIIIAITAFLAYKILPKLKTKAL